MSEFLLIGVREAPAGELSPAQLGHDLAASACWQRALRGWGLLRAFALGPDAAAQPSVCLIVRATGPAAAARLAAGWERVARVRVTTLPLVQP